MNAVSVDLVPGGVSRVTVTSDAPLREETVTAALSMQATTSSPEPDHHTGPPGLAAGHARARQPCRRSADCERGQQLIEAAGTRLLDKDLELVRAHLHSLAEIIGNDDPPLRRRIMVNEQFRAPAIALTAQHNQTGQVLLIIHRRSNRSPA